MPFELSSRVTRSLSKIQKTPAMVILFDGIPNEFSSFTVYGKSFLDSGLYLDSGLNLDTKNALPTQITALSFEGGSGSTSTKIDYKIDPDLGIGDSITTMKLAFVDDKKNTILSLLDNYEMLGRKVRVKMVIDSTSALYPQDYITIFRGIVDEVSYNAGKVQLSLSHPDQKKRQTIFVEHKTELTAAISNSDATIPVANAAGFFEPVLGPDGTYTTNFVRYVRIDDEIIFFTGVSGSDLTTCLRGQLSTSAVAHDDEAEVTSFYVLQGNSMDLALQIMLSGWAGSFVSDVSILRIEASDTIVFTNDLFDQYGLTIGDYLTTTGADNGANNVTLKTIASISYDEDTNETTMTLNDVTFVDETSLSMVSAFRSRYDVLPSGLRMTPDEVDVDEHELLKSFYLFSADYLFYLKGTIDNAKDFITKQIYQPVAAFSIPKKTKASLGYTNPPLPDELLTTLDSDNIKDPEKISHFRQLGRNFYNTILYKYNEDQLEAAFNAGLLITNTDSKARIPIGSKVFTIEANGLRSGNVATSAASRRLFRYKFAAAQIKDLKTTFGQGFSIDIGDNIIIDGESLLIPDISTGTRAFTQRLFQIIQKSIDLKTGDVNLVVLDTSFSENSRYGYISPASSIASVASDKVFTIETSFAPPSAEYNKWSAYVGSIVQVRNDDFTVTATGEIESVGTDNVITLVNDLSVTPSAGMVMEFSDYDIQTKDRVKLFYTHITNGSADFGDGGSPYYMI